MPIDRIEPEPTHGASQGIERPVHVERLDVVPLLVADPMGAMAFFARSDDTDATAVEVAVAFGVVDDNDAALMLAGLCARELGPIAREAARRRSFSAILRDAAHAPRARPARCS